MAGGLDAAANPGLEMGGFDGAEAVGMEGPGGALDGGMFGMPADEPFGGPAGPEPMAVPAMEPMAAPAAESDALRNYREENARKVQAKVDAERAELEAIRSAAAAELKRISEERDRKVAQMKKNNREAESISSAEQAGVNSGNVWEAVVKLCPDKPPEHGRVDTSAMRSLYVKLKHAPPSARA